jgi:cytochrome b561
MTSTQEVEVSTGYSGVAIALHWLTAILIVANLLLGLSMVDLPFSPRKLQWYIWHKWIGITVFLITSIRLGWRAAHPAPKLVAMPAWQRRAASVSHKLLYALLLLIPISGWLYSSATGVQVVYLGIVPLPNLVPKDKMLADLLLGVHIGGNSMLFAVVCLHATAALWHHLVKRDETLVRMLPFIKQRRAIE